MLHCSSALVHTERMSEPVILALLLVTVVLITLMVRARLSLQRRSPVDRWAASRGLTLTADNRPLVVHYRRMAAWLRRFGAVVGFFLPMIVASTVDSERAAGPGGWVWLWAVVGYLAGALGAEVALGRPLRTTERLASLQPRELDDYLPAFLRHAVRSAGLAALALAAVVALVGFDRSEASGMGHLSDGAAMVLGGVGLAAAVLIERVQLWILSRPQPVVALDLLEADDAVRSQSVITIAAAGLSLLLLILSVQFWTLANSDVQVLRWVMWVPAVASSTAAFASWLGFGNVPWAVHRRSRTVGLKGAA